ncbi:uncharacterized protein LOC129592883 isoform X2 [Paramacrobiotus metropolitanus]|uniref:uncharacterized protein LOC129592883 isoform X2 n=1 Tax=Paramacrobiotus metropolitanus TaxID=2943436 RepID=UPI0024458A9A|nr:uncharacterized protein LOC129592883 isoform X2 [Paramacrobiotus metropolitanus]
MQSSITIIIMIRFAVYMVFSCIRFHGSVVANAVTGEDRRWPDNTIPYEFARDGDDFTTQEKQFILKSMVIISRLTGDCVRFVVRTTETDYVLIKKGTVCSSSVGRQSGNLTMTFTASCTHFHGDIQHQLMHAMGFYHEHSRSDRDDYVTIFWDNIAEMNRDQFRILSGNTYGLPYDYQSVMHYKVNAFAKDSAVPTILPKEKHVRMGQRDNLSILDVARIQRHFKCTKAIIPAESIVEETTKTQENTTSVAITTGYADEVGVRQTTAIGKVTTTRGPRSLYHFKIPIQANFAYTSVHEHPRLLHQILVLFEQTYSSHGLSNMKIVLLFEADSGLPGMKVVTFHIEGTSNDQIDARSVATEFITTIQGANIPGVSFQSSTDASAETSTNIAVKDKVACFEFTVDGAPKVQEATETSETTTSAVDSTTEDAEEPESNQEPFPQFSEEPVSMDQCSRQFTKNCRPPTLQPSECDSIVSTGLEISCMRSATAEEIRTTATSLSQPPRRAISVEMMDSVGITSSNFFPVRQQAVRLRLWFCVSSRTTGKLRQLRFVNLLEFQLIGCSDLDIMKNDFQHSTKLKIILFRSSTIKNLQKGTFSDLQDLRLLSLEGSTSASSTANTTEPSESLRKIQCGCEFVWFREWWNNNKKLLRRVDEGAVYTITNAFYNGNYEPEEIHLPMDCKRPAHATSNAVNQPGSRFSINAPTASEC